ncbi:hypothetical protein FLP10_15130 [Agromyces intestinalis]|uniref:Uncharacterized protein n=1 Tax=Agromyces intestinalis TaxID=2592652 RepID=A0A5C1YLC7_9MICO|nr:hypothetical protein [Agromyces intestinalis]QEO15612.1 hypothetical protein FLP10_15130 [Agromyces intestinalis]
MNDYLNVPGTIPAYFARADVRKMEEVQLDYSHGSPVRRLSMLERATARVSARSVLDCPQGYSLLHEAALRLAVFESRHILEHASASWVARTLQSVLGNAHPVALRNAWQGWAILAALDRADLGVEVWLSREPDDPFGPWTRVRLSARCDELGAPR